MSTKVLNVTAEAHAAAKAAAESAGVSMTQWASERLTHDQGDGSPWGDGGMDRIANSATTMNTSAAIRFLDEWVSDEHCSRISALADARSESPSATLTAALDALERPRGVTPAPKVEMLAPDGDAYCKCDGQPHPGPWHSRGCPRHSETEVPW